MGGRPPLGTFPRRPAGAPGGQYCHPQRVYCFPQQLAPFQQPYPCFFFYGKRRRCPQLFGAKLFRQWCNVRFAHHFHKPCGKLCQPFGERYQHPFRRLIGHAGKQQLFRQHPFCGFFFRQLPQFFLRQQHPGFLFLVFQQQLTLLWQLFRQ